MNANSPISPFSVFRRRSFTLMWSAQLVSTIGTALSALAASILVFQMTDSAFSVGLMLIATAAPGLLMGLFAGVIVDRYDRRRIMILADGTRGVLVLMIPWLASQNIVWLYILIAAISAVGQFFDPAHESLIPELASDEELAAANSMMAISAFGSTAIGFAAAGLIASTAGVDWAFYIDALTFIVSAVCIYFVRTAPFEVDEESSAANVLDNLKAGYRTVSETPVLRSLFLVFFPLCIGIGLTNSLLLPFAVRALGATEFEYGVQEAMTSVGFVAGSLLMAGIFNRMREGPWVAISLIAMAVIGLIYATVSSVALAIVLLTISGFVMAPYSIAKRLMVQRNTPREFRGRVNSVYFVLRDLLFIVGMGLAGLADLIDIRIMYALSSLFLLAAGLMGLVLPGFRQEAAEWRRALNLLRKAPSAPAFGQERPALAADLDALIGHVPALARISASQRQALLEHGSVLEAEPGALVLRQGETGDDAYFVLSGRLVAGFTDSDGVHRYLSTMNAGDFFGEIAALSGARRTANVVVEDQAALYHLTGSTLRQLMDAPELSRLFLAKMGERLSRSNVGELPKMNGYDQQALRALREAPAAGG